MAKLHVKKGDKVKVIAGKDKGKEGVIIRSLPQSQRVVVEKVNMMKKHVRPSQNDPQGGIKTMEAPIHVSNVQLICPSCKAATRVSRVRNEDGKLVRMCKKCNKPIDK